MIDFKMKSTACLCLSLVMLLSSGVTFAAIKPTLLDGVDAPEDPQNAATGKLSAIFGWEGDRHAAIAIPNAFLIKDRAKPIRVGFGILDDATTFKWYNAEGYLPALVAEFEKEGCLIKIINFGDKVVFDGNDYVIAYSRVSIRNNSSKTVSLSPQPEGELINLNNPGNTVKAGKTVNHDFAVTLDRFGNNYEFPSFEKIKKAGGFNEHYDHMKKFWNDKLSEIVQIDTPYDEFDNYYRATFIYNHIIKDGHKPHGGENGYDRMFDHGITGRMAVYMTLGYYSESEELFKYLPHGSQYDDATWKYCWPWSLYILKTDDTELPGKYWDKIKSAGHKIVNERTGPQQTMKKTPDIDSWGYWTIDNWSALFGLRCYEYVCQRLGEPEEAAWAQMEYRSFLKTLNEVLEKNLKKNNLNYIPVSLIESNDANRCKHGEDACWVAHLWFGRWPWEGWLAGAEQYGVNVDLIDATYDYGLERLKKAGVPEYTYGWFPPNIYNRPGLSTVYNAALASSTLRGEKYRTRAIKDFQFMIDYCQSGPFCFWETIEELKDQPWEGNHPVGGHGCCPHPWGQSAATKVILESILAEFYDGKLLVGRGISNDWLQEGKLVKVTNFPISHNKRTGVKICTIDQKTIALEVLGDEPANSIIFNLPVFKHNLESASAGIVNNFEGCVILAKDTRKVEVKLKMTPGEYEEMLKSGKKISTSRAKNIIANGVTAKLIKDYVLGSGSELSLTGAYIGTEGAEQDVTLTVNGGKITYGSGEPFYVQHAGHKKGSLVINDGEVSTGYLLIGNDSEGSVVVNGGKLNISAEHALIIPYANNTENLDGSVKGSLTVTGGEVDCAGYVLLRNGASLNIEGGIITVSKVFSIENGGVVNMSGGMLVFENHDYTQLFKDMLRNGSLKVYGVNDPSIVYKDGKTIIRAGKK